MRSKKTWRVKVVASQTPKPGILVADGGMARLFGVANSAGKKSLKEKATLERESAHGPGRALVTDRTGRVFDSGGRTGSGPPTRSRHGAESDYDPHAIEVLRFAKRISRRVDLERRAGKIGALIVIAEPRFLGCVAPAVVGSDAEDRQSRGRQGSGAGLGRADTEARDAVKKRRRILILDGHPDGGAERYVHALAAGYRRGAESAGHEVRVVQVASLDVPSLRSNAEFQSGEPAPTVRAVQADLKWADHLVLLFPLWLGDMPGQLKVLLEQVLRPGFAFAAARGKGFPRKLLDGRSARVIVTMGMPAFFYRWYFRAHSVKNLERNILGFLRILAGAHDDRRHGRGHRRRGPQGAGSRKSRRWDGRRADGAAARLLRGGRHGDRLALPAGNGVTPPARRLRAVPGLQAAAAAQLGDAADRCREHRCGDPHSRAHRSQRLPAASRAAKGSAARSTARRGTLELCRMLLPDSAQAAGGGRPFREPARLLEAPPGAAALHTG